MIAASTEHAVKEFRRLISKMNADRADLQARYDMACEIIASQVEGTHGGTDRARAMVEQQVIARRS